MGYSPKHFHFQKVMELIQDSWDQQAASTRPMVFHGHVLIGTSLLVRPFMSCSLQPLKEAFAVYFGKPKTHEEMIFLLYFALKAGKAEARGSRWTDAAAPEAGRP